MKRSLRRCFIAMATTLALVAFSASHSMAQTVPSRVEAVYSSTASRTDIPLRVPSIIPLNSPATATEYWAASIAPSSEGYLISFDRAEDCSGVEECSFASAKGELDATSSRSYEQLSTQPRNEQVTLQDGSQALYSPSREGLYTPSSIYVKIDGYLYTFSIYMADKADVLEMANSALAIFNE